MSDGKVTIRPTADGGLLIHVPMLMRKRFGRKLIIAPEGLDGSSTGDHPASQDGSGRHLEQLIFDRGTAGVDD